MTYLEIAIEPLINPETVGMQIVLQCVEDGCRSGASVLSHDEQDDDYQQQDNGGQHCDDDADKVRLRLLVNGLGRDYCKNNKNRNGSVSERYAMCHVVMAVRVY